MPALYANSKLTRVGDFYVGMRVWLTSDAARTLAIPWRDIDDTFVLPSGVYTITRIERSRQNEFTDVYVMHSSWGDGSTPLMVNYDSDSFVVVGFLREKNLLRPYAENSKELDRLNQDRTKCMLCDNDLNMPCGPLKICNSCEGQFSGPQDTDEIPLGRLLLPQI